MTAKKDKTVRLIRHEDDDLVHIRVQRIQNGYIIKGRPSVYFEDLDALIDEVGRAIQFAFTRTVGRAPAGKGAGDGE